MNFFQVIFNMDKLVKIRGVLELGTKMRIVFELPIKTKEYIFGQAVEVNQLDIVTVYYN